MKRCLRRISNSVNGKKWRVLQEEDCLAMNHYSYLKTINMVLEKLGKRQLGQDRPRDVLTSNGDMRGARHWQVWFAMDMD